MVDLTTSFADSGADAITRSINLQSDEAVSDLPWNEFKDYYDVDRTVDEIIKGDYKRIALQFPDEMLNDSVPIFKALKAKIEGRDLYVLADTSYGSCCVDEAAAQHVDADAMVHYGHACMSQTSRLPVIYVFGKKKFDVNDCVIAFVESLKSSHPKAVLLEHDVGYSHLAARLVEELRSSLSSGVEVMYSPIPVTSEPTKHPVRTTLNGENGKGHPERKALSEDCAILYIGSESLALTDLLLTHGSSEVHRYDPKTKRAHIESVKTNKLLMKRYAVVQRARDADVFGILVGTLGVASYLPLISHLRKLLAKAKKKSYTISVGKLNPAKLANFMEIECFVLVACPENSLIDAKEFFRPIITPFELEVALKADRSWSGRYVLDFEQLLNADASIEDANSPIGDEEDDPDRPSFSLVTGKYRTAKKYGGLENSAPTEEGSSAVILRNGERTVARLAESAAAEFLQNRSFQGLETRIGRDAPSILEQGRSGIAKGYADDHQ